MKSSGPDSKSIKGLWTKSQPQRPSMTLFCPKLLSWCPFVNQVYTKLHLWRPFTKLLCPMSWRLSVPTLSQPSMFLLHHGLLISCDLLLCRGGHPLPQLHPGGLHLHSLHNGHIILHGDHHRFTAPWAMVSSSTPQFRPTIAPQSKPANAPRMLPSLPLLPSLSLPEFHGSGLLPLYSPGQQCYDPGPCHCDVYHQNTTSEIQEQ